MITVSNLNDTGAGSLRAALGAVSSFEEIRFSVSGTINLTSGQLVVNQNCYIVGPGSGLLTINGGGTNRVFFVTTGFVVTISGMTIFNGNDSVAANGGGIFNEATLTLNDVIVSVCVSTGNGGGIYNTSSIYAVNLSVIGCAASADGGGVWSNGTFGNFSSDPPWERGDVNGNICGGTGGGIYNDGSMWIKNVRIFNNTAGGSGGGFLVLGTLRLTECRVYDNTNTGNGAAIFNGNGTVTLDSSEISGHVLGGDNALYNNVGTFNIRNSTVSGNTIGIHNFFGSLDVDNSTIVLNGVGLFANSGGSISDCYNVILAGNTTFDYEGDTGDFISTGWNIFGNNSNPITPNTGDQPGFLSFASLALGTLQNNGGFTFTHAVESSSPALDLGNGAGAPDFDQRGRGYERVVNSTIDIGAFEAQPECFSFTGSLPSWLTLVDNCLVVTAGTFSAATKEEANALAQEALDNYVAAGIGDGSIVCGACMAKSIVFATQTLSPGLVFFNEVVNGYVRQKIGTENTEVEAVGTITYDGPAIVLNMRVIWDGSGASLADSSFTIEINGLGQSANLAAWDVNFPAPGTYDIPIALDAGDGLSPASDLTITIRSLTAVADDFMDLSVEFTCP